MIEGGAVARRRREDGVRAAVGRDAVAGVAGSRQADQGKEKTEDRGKQAELRACSGSTGATGVPLLLVAPSCHRSRVPFLKVGDDVRGARRAAHGTIRQNAIKRRDPNRKNDRSSGRLNRKCRAAGRLSCDDLGVVTETGNSGADLMRARLLALAIFSAAFPPQVAQAHHGWGSYDSDTQITLDGVVEEVRPDNPHAELMLAVEGRVWLVTLSPPSRMARRGLPVTEIAPGDRVVVIGYPSRTNEDEMRAESITHNGVTIQLR